MLAITTTVTEAANSRSRHPTDIVTEPAASLRHEHALLYMLAIPVLVPAARVEPSP